MSDKPICKKCGQVSYLEDCVHCRKIARARENEERLEEQKNGFLFLGGESHGEKIYFLDPPPAEIVIQGEEYHFRRLPLPNGEKKGIRYYVCVSSWRQG